MSDNVSELTTSVLYPDGRREAGESEVISEHNLTVWVNGKQIYRLVCTGQNLKELVTGRLKTDGLIEGPGDIYRMYFCKYENEVSVFLNNDVKWDDVIAPDPTCCMGNRVYALAGRHELKKLTPCDWQGEWVFDLVREFKKGTRLHDITGGVHICILAKEGRILYVGEDIGRHNAVDKAVGYALLHEIPLKECMIFTSGRVPVDMVEKVISAGIPVLVSKSVPTKESVQMAREYGLTLICRAWPDKCEIF